MNNQWKKTKINKMKLSTGVLLLGALFLAACQPAAAQTNPTALPTVAAVASAPTAMPAPTNTPVPTPTQPAVPTANQASQNTNPVASAEATLNIADNPKLGKILVDGNGMTLYMYTKDSPNQSNCSGQCLQAWPPLLTQGKPILGEGVDDSLVGTATLADGSMIVTYNKMPLYTWYKDTKPGDATGQGNKQVWYVVSPDGKAVGMPDASSSSDNSSNSGGYSYDK